MPEPAVVGLTGASGGIGGATAKLLRQRGYVVVEFGRQAGQYPLDFSGTEEALARQLGCGLTQFPPLTGWCNIAGADILSPPGGKAAYAERLRELWEVDVRATALLSRLVLPFLGPGAALINVGWNRAEIGAPGESGELYALAKAAITAYSRSLAKTWGDRARVYVVAPGMVPTRWAQSLTPDRQRVWLERLGYDRWTSPEMVAGTIVRLIEGSAPTGQVEQVSS